MANKGEAVLVDGKPVQVSREKGYLYFVDSDGVVKRSAMARKDPLTPEEIAKRKAEKEAKAKIREQKRKEVLAKKLAKAEQVSKNAIAKAKAKAEEIAELKKLAGQ